jgi:nitroreductase
MATQLTRRGVLGTAVAAAALGAVPPPGARGSSGCLDGLLSRRHMIRRFRADPVDDATIRRLLAAAVRAPSAGHTQPWAFVVARDLERRRALARAAHDQTFVGDAPVVVVACADLSRSEPRYRERARRYGFIDTAFASFCLLLAATEAGLGACFVGAFDDERVARLLDLPAHVQPVAIIPVGHPAEAPRPMRVRRLADVVRSERWTSDGTAAPVPGPPTR